MTMMAETSLSAPYNVLRPLRCRRTFNGKVCNAKHDNINWSQPGIHDWRCDGKDPDGKRCGAYNVVFIPDQEGEGADSATGPL